MKGYIALIFAAVLISVTTAFPKIRVTRQAARTPTGAKIPAEVPQFQPLDGKRGKALESEGDLDYDGENSLTKTGEEYDEPTHGNGIEEMMGLPSNATSIRPDISNNFECLGRGYGFYADVENECQVFHVCLPVHLQDDSEMTLKWSFICPAETIFNQETFTCTRADDASPCIDAPQFYRLNDNFGQASTPRDVEEATEEPIHYVEPEAVEIEAADEDDTVEVAAIEAKRPLIQQYLRRQPPVKYGQRH